MMESWRLAMNLGRREIAQHMRILGERHDARESARVAELELGDRVLGERPELVLH